MFFKSNNNFIKKDLKWQTCDKIQWRSTGIWEIIRNKRGCQISDNQINKMSEFISDLIWV